MKNPITVLAVIAISTAYASAGESTPVLQRVEQAIKPVLTGLSPHPVVKSEQGENGPTLIVQYEVRKFMVYSPYMTGGWSTNAFEEIGPEAKGFVLTINIEKLGEPEQLVTPQTMREPYWETYLAITPIAGTTNQAYWALSCGARADPALQERIKQAVRSLTANDDPKHETRSERIQLLKDEIGRLEARCVPTAGTARADVEQKFGPGTPGPLSKVPAQAPTNSLYRVYEFCTNGTLWVHYDKTWHVEWAYYEDPYQTKGLPAGVSIRPEEEIRELEQRLQQMKQIAVEYQKSFGGDSHP
ncbi:MAG TPA: hypothetical protein VKS19_01295 [Verrucomicrobiae bacterium]|nr:hypothetical protein [Verrucomicrobiae bacterium]